MASMIPHLYSNYSSCPNDPFSQFPNNPFLFSQENCIGGVAIPTAATSWGDHEDQEVSFPMVLDNFGSGLDHVYQTESDLTNHPCVQAALFPDLIGTNSASDMSSVVPTALPADNNNVAAAGFCGIGQNLGVTRYNHQFQDVCEFGDECSTGFVHQDFNQVNHDPIHVTDNWGIQGNQMVPAMEDNNLKVGRYSVEERKDRILRYLKKRNQRNFNKTIKYACRKTLADRRVRVRGRFAKNNELVSEEEMMIMMKKEDDNSPNDKNLYYCDALQIKHDEDDWLQEAMENLMHLPFVSG